MPIYEYQCTGKCGQKFEYMQSMSEPPKRKCERCGGKLERLISATGFVLKGGGWYKDLYSSSKPGAGAGSESKAEAAGGKSDKSEPKSTADKADKPKKATKAD